MQFYLHFGSRSCGGLQQPPHHPLAPPHFVWLLGQSLHCYGCQAAGAGCQPGRCIVESWAWHPWPGGCSAPCSNIIQHQVTCLGLLGTPWSGQGDLQLQSCRLLRGAAHSSGGPGAHGDKEADALWHQGGPAAAVSCAVSFNTLLCVPLSWSPDSPAVKCRRRALWRRAICCRTP